MRAYIVVVDLELEHFLIAYGISDHIRMQLTPEYALGVLIAQCILASKDRRAGKTKLIETFELLLQVFLGFTKLAAMALIEDKHHLLVVHRQVTFALHQVV